MKIVYKKEAIWDKAINKFLCAFLSQICTCDLI